MPADERPGRAARITEQTSTDRVELPGWARAAAASVDLAELTERVVQVDLAAAFADCADDEVFVARLRASVAENLALLRDVLVGRRRQPELIVDRPLEFGETQARLGIPQAALHKSYRAGFTAMWESWSAAVAAAAEAAGVDTAEALAAANVATRAIMAYHDRVATQVAHAYVRIDAELNQSRSRLRQRLVRELLAGSDPPPPADLVILGYDLETWHVAVVLGELTESAADRLAADLRSAAGVRSSLVYQLGVATSAVWLGRLDGWTAARQRRLHTVLDQSGLRASVSDPALGVAGFRSALGQAEDIERVRTAWGAARANRLLRYCDVALDALLLCEPDAARRFVRAELGALATSTTEGERLRETLEASMRHGTHVGTAEALGVHEHTVRNRLRRVEEKLGPDWSTRRTELQVALRLHRLLGPPDR